MYTRRDIGRLALASLPLARAFAKLDSHVNGVLIGAQSYSFRDRPLDAAIQGFVDVGLSECELSMGHVEPEFPRGPEGRAALRKWRLNVPLDDIRAIRRKFDQAGIELSAYAYNMRDDFTDEEIARGFEMAQALGVKAMTTSATVSVTPRIAAQAEKYKIVVGMHGHSNIKDPNEYRQTRDLRGSHEAVAVYRGEPGYRALLGGGLRSGAIHRGAPRAHRDAAHQGSQEESGQEHAVRRGRHARSRKCCNC